MSLKHSLDEKEQLIRQLESELEYYYKLARSESPQGAGERGRLLALESRLEVSLKQVVDLTAEMKNSAVQDKELRARVTAQLSRQKQLELELAGSKDRVSGLVEELQQANELSTQHQHEITVLQETRNDLEVLLASSQDKVHRHIKLLKVSTSQHLKEKQTATILSEYIAGQPLLRIVRFVREARNIQGR